MPAVTRILDANANRAREALRVMEEAARFILNNAELTQAIKQLRHDLASALSLFPGAMLEAHRDTPGDVGTTLSTPSETFRGSTADVAIAAGKRLSEALRAIEEYSKVHPGAACGLASAVEALRYRGYEIERRLNLALASTRARQWRLCVLLSAELCPNRDWLGVARAVVEAGGDCLQLREKNLDADELLQRARQLVALGRPHGVSVIINDRPDVALVSEADGVHVGQTDLPCKKVRKLVGRQLIVGVSTSNLDQARQALAEGADYCGVGPMFPTTTKHKPVLAGPPYLAAFLKEFPGVPHLAIGGITPENVGQLVQLGCRGVAVSNAVCAASDPADVVRILLNEETHG